MTEAEEDEQIRDDDGAGKSKTSAKRVKKGERHNVSADVKARYYLVPRSASSVVQLEPCSSAGRRICGLNKESCGWQGNDCLFKRRGLECEVRVKTLNVNLRTCKNAKCTSCGHCLMFCCVESWLTGLSGFFRRDVSCDSICHSRGSW